MLKKKSAIMIASAVLLFAGCTTLQQFLGAPELRVAGVSIDSIDMEGISFRLEYIIDNPYPVGIAIKSVGADVGYSGQTVVELQSESGLELAAASESANNLIFKLPYESIFELVGEGGNEERLRFTIDGWAGFDISTVPYMDKKTLEVPFSTDFEVPVFKPEISMAKGRIVMPSLKEVTGALVRGGVNVFKAGVLAGKIVLGESIEDIVFEEIDLDVMIELDLKIDNKGGAPFVMELKRCGIDSELGALIEMNIEGGVDRFESSGKTVKMVSVINTLEFGGFIAGIAGGEFIDTSIVLESIIDFPGMPYEALIPLDVNLKIEPGMFDFGAE